MVDPAEHAARAGAAETLRDRWGCTAAGRQRLPVLPPDLAAAAEHHAEVTGTKPCGTCPNARVRLAGPWAFEVFRALRLMRESKGSLRFHDITGRTPHVWDVRALDAITSAWGAAWESDEAIRKAEAETTRDQDQ